MIVSVKRKQEDQNYPNLYSSW